MLSFLSEARHHFFSLLSSHHDVSPSKTPVTHRSTAPSSPRGASRTSPLRRTSTSTRLPATPTSTLPPAMPPTRPPNTPPRVLLTGFGSFHRTANNPSFLICSSLPSTVHTRHGPITLIPLATPVRVSFPAVDAVLSSVWSGEHGDFDYVLHLGLGGSEGYKLETVAHTSGYCSPDVDGYCPGGEDDGETLRTAIDVERICEMVRRRVQVSPRPELGLEVPWVTKRQGERPGEGVEIRGSDDAGRYLCEYIFRGSLLEAEKRWGREEGGRRVLFCHVPGEEVYGIETGVEVVSRVVEGIVAQGEGWDKDGDEL